MASADNTVSVDGRSASGGGNDNSTASGGTTPPVGLVKVFFGETNGGAYRTLSLRDLTVDRLSVLYKVKVKGYVTECCSYLAY